MRERRAYNEGEKVVVEVIDFSLFLVVGDGDVFILF